MKQTKNINPNRRKVLLGSAAVGSALTVWHKPLMQSVVLPAHAQTTSPVDFFASQASATQVVQNANSLLDMLIPEALALQNRPNPLGFTFSAEAIDNSDGTYAIKVVAEETAVADDFTQPTQTQENQGFNFSVTETEPDTEPEPQQRVFIQDQWGWSGTLGQTGSSLLIGTGCAMDESASILSISGSSLELQMGFFGSVIKLNLTPGTTTLPSFPLSCNIS
jgi:hypothetical protein